MTYVIRAVIKCDGPGGGGCPVRAAYYGAPDGSTLLATKLHATKNGWCVDPDLCRYCQYLEPKDDQ